MGLKLENVNYIYDSGSIGEVTALKDVSLEIEKGEFVAIIGHTGSGKSTLIQHFNGLIKSTSGKITYDGKDIYGEKYNICDLRRKIGLVFQYPEHQLFEENILKDVCFGPMNLGLNREEAKEKAKNALQQVGINEKLYHKSPFELSGGQKRRVAIAGILAMEPDIIILDEPTAGLDPAGRDKILNRIKKLHDETGIGVVLVSHSMEDVAKYAERIIVMRKGQVMFDGSPKEVFGHYKELEEMGLSAPKVTYVMHKLKEQGLNVDTSIINIDEAKENIVQAIKNANR